MAQGELQSLRDVIQRLLAAALQADIDHAAELERSEIDHLSAIDWLEVSHAAELAEHDTAHRVEVDQLRAALETRGVIGQAQGIIMATMHCSAAHAFGLLVAQSKHENRKVAEIAREIAERVENSAA